MCVCKDCALCAGVRVFMHVDARSECPVCSIEAGLPESGAHRCSAGLKASNCPELGLQVFVGMFYSLNDFWDLIWVLMIVGHMLLTTEPSVSPETRFSYPPLRFRRRSSKAG